MFQERGQPLRTHPPRRASHITRGGQRRPTEPEGLDDGAQQRRAFVDRVKSRDRIEPGGTGREYGLHVERVRPRLAPHGDILPSAAR